MSEVRQSDTEPVLRRTRRRTGENRDRLIRAGIAIFAVHGYHGASTSDIADLAEVPQPHIYANFRTKQDLFLACLAHVGRAMQSAPGSPAEASATSLYLTAGADRPVGSTHSSIGAFLLQAFAAAEDERLQPKLGECLRKLSTEIGETRLVAEVAADLFTRLR